MAAEEDEKVSERIEDPELAHEMALIENEEWERARIAEKLGTRIAGHRIENVCLDEASTFPLFDKIFAHVLSRRDGKREPSK